MPVYLSEGSTQPYRKETTVVVVSSYGHGPFANKQVDLYAPSGQTKTFYKVDSVTINARPTIAEENCNGKSVYVLPRGSHCAITRGADGKEYLQCERRGKHLKFTPGPRPKR